VLGDTGDDPALLLEGDGPQALAWRDWVEPADVERGADGFERLGVADAIEALADPAQPLPGGARMTVEATRALVAVDVDTGTDTSPAAALKANLAMAQALPRALRLRGLGGQVVVDPAPSPKRDRRQVESALKAALRADPVQTAVLGWTALGHIELQRQRARPPLPL
jgi:Rne/Rng family ribonuclease